MALVAVLLGAGCGPKPDEKAYDDVLRTMSAEKAKRFFETYPRSLYRDRLADAVAGWCRGEPTPDCYRILLRALPADHARYRDVLAEYQARFPVEARQEGAAKR